MTDLDEADEKIGEMRSDDQIGERRVDAAQMPEAADERVEKAQLPMLGTGGSLRRLIGRI